jgi:hypothetical protein
LTVLRVESNEIQELWGYGSSLKRFAYALDAYASADHGLETLFSLEESLSASAYLLGLGDIEPRELLTYFPHKETPRMFYATMVRCESAHVSSNAHLELHTEPSRWLRISYPFGCSGQPARISSTLVPWSTDERLDIVPLAYQQGDWGLTFSPAFPIMKNAFTYSDWLGEDAEEFNFELGLSFLGTSAKSVYANRERAEKQRYQVFFESIPNIVW